MNLSCLIWPWIKAAPSVTGALLENVGWVWSR